MDKGILTDGPDYIYLDGRPTPFGMKQKRKLYLQREYAVSCYKNIYNIEFGTLCEIYFLLKSI